MEFDAIGFLDYAKGIDELSMRTYPDPHVLSESVNNREVSLLFSLSCKYFMDIYTGWSGEVHVCSFI